MTLSEQYDALSAELDQETDDNKWVEKFTRLIEIFKQLRGIE